MWPAPSFANGAAFVSIVGLAIGLLPPADKAACAQTPPAPVVSQNATLAIRELQNPQYFAIGGVGYAGRMSQGEAALRVLPQEKNAVVYFRNLLKTAPSAGQLYALMGLRQTAGNAEFAAAAAGFHARKDMVKTFSGCMGMSEPVGTVAARIEKGNYLLRPSPKPSPSPRARRENKG